MVKKQTVIKTKADGWEPSQQDLDIILNRLKVTKQENITYIDRNLYRKICREYKTANPEEEGSSVSYKYFTLVKYMRHIFKHDFMEFMKWVSDPQWVFEIDYAVYDFFKTGNVSPMVAAAAEADQGGFFKYCPDAQIELVEMSRGSGKTTKWSAIRAAWLKIAHPTYKWLVVSGDKDKAKALLKSIREIICNPYLEMIYPDIFSEDAAIFKSRKGNVLTSEKIDIATFNEETEERLRSGDLNYEFRKEATYMICSPQIDRTSFHFEGIIADDLVTDPTSYSPEQTRNLVKFFRSIFAMQQYRDGWRFRCFMTGTEWWMNSLYTELRTWDNVSIFCVPGKWRYGDKNIRLCRHFTDKFFEDQRTLLGEWNDSQMFMKPRPYADSGLDIGFSHTRNVTRMSLAELEKLKEENMVVQICDPSYSIRNKKEGDRKSRFTIMNAVVTETAYYIYGGYQCLGKDVSGVKATNTQIGMKEDIDFFIQDAQGTQQNFYDEQIAEMRSKIPCLVDFQHTQRIKGTTGKEQAANAVLKELMLVGDIQIVEVENDPDVERTAIIKEIIQQFCGFSGMDFVDCTVYMVADIDKSYDVMVARLNKRRKRNATSLKMISLSGGNKRFRRLA